MPKIGQQSALRPRPLLGSAGFRRLCPPRKCPSDRIADLHAFALLDKGHGRIEERTITVAREVAWLEGARRFPGELRLPDVACVVRVASRTELKDCCRFETRYYISSAPLTAAHGVRGHWRIESAGTGALRARALAH